MYVSWLLYLNWPNIVYDVAIPLLKSHAEFLVARHAHFSADGDAADSADAFSTPWTRMMLKSVMTRAVKDISKVTPPFLRARIHVTDFCGLEQ